MPSFAERARVGIAPLAAADRDEWLAFQGRSHGVDSRQADPEWLAWLEADPDLRGLPLRAWICRRNGEIVGSQGSIPFRLKEGSRLMGASWAVDLMVDPAWRLRGVGPALTEAHTSSEGLVVALSISEAAYRAYLRGGWVDLGDIPNYVRPRDVGWSIREAGLHGARAIAAQAVIRPALAATRFGTALAARLMGTSLQRIDRFDERVDRVWATAAKRYPVIAARDLAALAWRFDGVPDADEDTRYYLMQGQRVRGYVVTRLEPWRDGQVLAIVDFLATPRWLLPLLGHVVALDQTREAVAVTCRALGPGSELAFRAAGFIRVVDDARSGPLDRSAGTPLRFMVYRGDQPDRPAFDRDQWFVTGGDSDFRWRSARV
jgi:Acetyltransferase (GNAT) domain